MNIFPSSPSRTKSILALILIAVSLGALGYYLFTPSKVSIKTRPQGGNFQLESINGPISLANYQGKVVLMFFGFTRCPDVCPTTLSDLTRLIQILPEEQTQQLQILFISLDSSRDNIQTAQTYLNNFNSKFTALTGSEAVLKKVTAQYGAFYHKSKVDSQMGYTIDHSTQVFVIAPNGRWVDSIRFGSSAEEMREQLQPLLGALKN